MKKIIAMAVLVLSSVGAFAQYSAGDFTLQPKVGLNVSNLTDYSEDGDTDWKAGLAIGVEGEYHINNWLGISAGLLYSQQGTKGSDGVGIDDVKFNFDYLNVPILANFYVAKGLSLKAGIQPGFNVSKKAKYQGVSVDFDKVLDKLDDGKFQGKFQTVDFSVPIGIAYEYAGFCIDARYILGGTNVIKDVDGKNQVFQLTLGYKFKL